MRVRDIKYEDFVNYRKPSMFISTVSCSFKCFAGMKDNLCQNLPLLKCPVVEIDDSVIIGRYLSNPITSAVVFGGLEPFDQIDEIEGFIRLFRRSSDDDVVIYTGYEMDESAAFTGRLRRFGNIVVKFGRCVPGTPSVYDEVLGVFLNSSNQFAVRL